MYVVIDIETTGLSRFKDEITYFGAYLPDKDEYFIFDEPSLIKSFLITCKAENRKTVMQNGKFDSLFVEYKLGIKIPIHHDTMLMGTAYDLVAPHDLKDMAQKYLGVSDWDIPLKEKKKKSASLKEYLKYDLLYTWELFEFFKKSMNKTQIKLYKELLLPAYKAYKKVEKKGVYLDQKGLQEVGKTYRANMDKALKDLNKHYNINWNSAPQVQKILFNNEKLPVIKRTKKGSPSADAKSLKRLALQGYEIPKLLLDYKKYYGAVSKFITPWNEYLSLSMDSRLHPTFKLTNVVTGRTSCSDPNLQQVPRDKSLRNLFTAPKGKVFIEADYSQLELRIAAHYSQDPMMLQIYRDGGDIHSLTAESLAGKNFTKEHRTLAKAVNFGFLYGMLAKGFIDYAYDNYGVSMTLEEAEAYRNKFFATYAGLLPWHKNMEIECEMLGGVYNLFGRFRALPDIYSCDFGAKDAAIRQAINTPVQGTGSDLLLSAMIEIDKELTYASLVGSVHDSILIEAPETMAEQAVADIKRIMESPKLLNTFNIKLSVPLVADVEVGAWGTK